jgi:arabinogalactan oligomer/maltooligosaccharide transport system substrate-binding protein
VQFGQIEEAVRTDQSGPQEIDVVQWHAFAAGANGFAQPVTDLFEDTYDEGYFVPGAIDDVTWGADVYGVPLDVNAVVLLVNVDAVEAAGHTVDDLSTWDGARQVAAALADDGVRLTYVPASSWTTYSWIRANGGEVFDIDESNEPVFSFDDPRTIEAFTFLHDLVADEQAFVPDAQELSLDGLTLFLDGQSATLTTGSWDVAELTERPPDFEWTVIPMPRGPSITESPHTVLGGSSLFVSRVADDRELAFELAAHLIDPDYSLAYAKDDGRLPPQAALLDDPFFDDPRYEIVVDNLPFADAMRLLSYPTVTNIYTNAISDILKLRTDPADALAGVQASAADAAARDMAEGTSG